MSRSAGMLKALAVALKPDGNSIIEGSGTALFATAHSGISQNVNRGLGLLKSEQDLKVQVGADLLQEDKDAKLLVRYWLGSDKSKAVVQEMSFSKSYKEEDSYGTENNYIVGNPLLYTGADIDQASLRQMQVEVIVVPSNGSPMTYATHLYKTKNKNDGVSSNRYNNFSS